MNRARSIEAMESMRLAEIRREPILLAYQKRWFDDDARLRVIEKSRRVGITFAEAFRFVYSRMSGNRPFDLWFSSADESAAEEFASAVAAIARALNSVMKLVANSIEVEVDDEVIDEKKIRKFQVVVPVKGGGEARLTAMTSNPRRFRSKGGDVTLDEFAFHEDAEGMLKAAMPCTTWGGQLSIISTHNGEQSVFNQLVMMGKRRRDPETHGEPKPTDRDVSLHTVTITDAVEQGLVELINRTVGTNLSRSEFLADCKKQSGPHFDEEFMCVPSGEESSYFPSSLTRPCATVPADVIVERVGEGELDRLDDLGRGDVDRLLGILTSRSKGATALHVGVDIGRSVDRFVPWIVAKFGETHRTVGMLVWQDMPFSAMEAACDRLMTWRSPDGRKVRRMVIDSTGIGAQIGESMERKHRHRAEAVDFTTEFKAEIFTLTRTHVEQRTVTIPDDIATLADLASIAKTITTAGKVRFAGARTKDGHADRATALALALHAADEAPGSVSRPVEALHGVTW